MKYQYARPIAKRKEHKAMMIICDYYRNPEHTISQLRFDAFLQDFGGNPNMAENVLNQLVVKKWIIYGHISSSPFKEIVLTESGKLYPENEYAARQEKIRDKIYFWITTVIAVVALIISLHEMFH